MRARSKQWLVKGYEWFRRRDLLVLILVLLVVLGFWGFIELADEVNEGDVRVIDEWLIRVMRNPADPSDPVGPHWLEEAVRDVTALGGIVVLALVSAAVAGFLAVRRQYHALGLLAAAILGALLINAGLKDFFDRPRPDLVPHLMRVSTPSFPSGHSLLSAVVYLTLGSLLARVVREMKLKVYVISVSIALTLVVGMSRVYLGVHFPSDVVAGWTVGLVWAILCWLAARYLQHRGAVEKAD